MADLKHFNTEKSLKGNALKERSCFGYWQDWQLQGMRHGGIWVFLFCMRPNSTSIQAGLVPRGGWCKTVLAGFSKLVECLAITQTLQFLVPPQISSTY